MRIAVCDDDSAELQRIKNAVEKYAALHLPEAEMIVNAFKSGDDLLCGIKKLGRFDLMILDIIMPGMNGVDLAREIRESGDGGKIIFLTSSPEYAVESYRVSAFYYLLKPWQEEELFSLISRAMLTIKDERGGCIIVKNNGMLTKVELRALAYVESANHNVRFHLQGGTVIECFGSLNKYQSTLAADGRFVKCHKSFVVNMDCVQSVTNKEFILAGGCLIPISRNIYRQVKSAYFDYFFRTFSGKETSNQ